MKNSFLSFSISSINKCVCLRNKGIKDINKNSPLKRISNPDTKEKTTYNGQQFIQGSLEGKNLLNKHTKLKMICTNPDLIVHRGSKTEYCAGTLASIFEKLGGKVVYFGKPHPEIYDFCIKKKETTLGVGDNIRTDIIGANNMNFDSLLVTHGIHKNEFTNLSIKDYDKILANYNAKTNYYQEELTW